MTRCHRSLSALSVVVLLFVLCPIAGAAETALDRYVRKPDSHYSYQLVSKTVARGYTAYWIQMTSQQWRTEADVDQPIWKHWMILYRPDHVKSSTGLLFISNGTKGEAMPKEMTRLAEMAVDTGTVVAELRDIPNQKLTFKGDTFGPRTEDEIIAWTWRKFLQTGDETWPLRLPMTKAAVRGLDTMTAFCASGQGGGVKVDRFVVAGASKRGWTTWTVAAVDHRVVAIAPMVIDVLNVVESFRHHYRVYGFWAPAVRSYEQMNLMDEIETGGYAKLMEIEDPFAYRERYTMPKLLINASGDQFFLPDSSKYYFDALPGEKHLLYLANSDHSMRGTDAGLSLEAFYQSILDGSPRPEYQVEVAKDGTLRVRTTTKPESVKLWTATNPEHRDFRVDTIGLAYKATELSPKAVGVYEAKVPKPPQGFTAYFIEMTFPGSGRYPFKFTTPIQVVPDVEPYTLPRRPAASR